MRQLPIPNSVFHYTTVEGLFHIIKDHQFRMTSADGVNDAQEIIAGHEHVRRFLRCNQSRAGAQAALSIMEMVDDPRTNTYIFCASGEEDDASQWERYGAEGRGFAIEIGTTEADRLGVYSSEVVPPGKSDIFRFFHDTRAAVDQWTTALYTVGQRAEALEARMSHWETQLEEAMKTKDIEPDDEGPDWDSYWNGLLEDCSTDFVSLANSMKHDGFRAENEFRVVATAERPLGEYAFYRPSQYGIVSSVYLVAQRDDESYGGMANIPPGSPVPLLPIRRVIAGPRHSAAQVDRLRGFLGSKGYGDVRVDLSKVPIR